MCALHQQGTIGATSCIRHRRGRTSIMPREIDLACRLWQQCVVVCVIVVAGPSIFAQDWPQLLGSGLRSGDASDFVVDES